MADPAAGVDAHARHDPTRIAGAVGVRVLPADVTTRLHGCAACAGLYADLRAIAALLPGTSVPARPRDFTLTPTDATRLRRRGPSAWFRRVGTARDTVTRPLAAGFSTLGLAGLLLAVAPVGAPAGTAGIGVEAAPSTVPIGVQASPGGADVPDAGGRGHSGDDRGLPMQTMTAADAEGPAPLVLLSGSFLAVGGALFGLRRVGARQAMR